MFALTQTFTHSTGVTITPIQMHGIGFVFLPKEIEDQLEYQNLADMVRQSDSFAEEIEYIILREDKLLQLKRLLHSRNSIPQVSISLTRTPSLIVLTEAGLYTVMFLSRKTNAQIFRRWVTSEVLPSIRKTGMYKIPDIETDFTISELSTKYDILQQTIHKQQQMIKKLSTILAKQEQFQQYSICAFERIEAVLAEALPHDMFSSWRKIKELIDDMTKVYHLSDSERKRYIRELCHHHDVHLPDKAFSSDEPSMLLDGQEIAIKLGIYSTNNKPHSRLVTALIRHLGLEPRKDSFSITKKQSFQTSIKYPDTIIPHIWQWLGEEKYPETVEIVCKKTGKAQKFRVRYRLNG